MLRGSNQWLQCKKEGFNGGQKNEMGLVKERSRKVVGVIIREKRGEDAGGVSFIAESVFLCLHAFEDATSRR